MPMDLYINTPGTYLTKKNDMFELTIETGEGEEKSRQKTKISPKKVRSIVLSTHALLTTDVIKLAVDNNIDIVLTDGVGEPYGRFWHARFGSTALIRRRQMEVFAAEEGLELAKEWIINKIDLSITHLKELEYKRHSAAGEIEDEIKAILEFREKIQNVSGTIGEARNTIMGYEGNASKHYYKVISHLIPAPYKFQGRSSRPAKDEYNCLLNYAFGVLYGKVEKACIIAGLDPYVGILHTDNYNKISLVFDFIENYRYLAWKVVFSLFSRKLVNKNYFDETAGGLRLNKEGKKVLLEQLTEQFEKKTVHNDKKISWLDSILHAFHELANKLIGKIDKEEL